MAQPHPRVWEGWRETRAGGEVGSLRACHSVDPGCMCNCRTVCGPVSSWVRGFMAILLGVSASNQRREAPGRLLSASVESQMHSSQKNPCAKVSHFGVMYSDPLHLPPK